MYHGQKSHLYFTDPPNFEELCQVTVQVPAINKDPNKPRSLQPQIIKCRELIFTEPDIIATPSIDHETQISIIMQQSMYKSGKLQSRFQKMGIQADRPRQVTSPEFQFCLNYTLLAKLAPAWNKVGEYLIQGRDFLTNRQKLNAVDFQLTVNELEMFLSLHAYVLRLPPIQLSDLDIPKPVINEFLATREKIEEFSIQRQWCHILPSMKKGQIVTVSRQLPPDCPYKSYRELKRFWKNTYGYRLPEDDIDMIYYQVYFRPLGGTLFTYPECCLRPRGPVILPRPDDDIITKAFLSDLHNKMPSICGRKFRFSNQANYTSCGLLNSDQVEGRMEDNYHLNLTQQRPTTWRPGVYTASQPGVNSVPQRQPTSQSVANSVPQRQPNSSSFPGGIFPLTQPHVCTNTAPPKVTDSKTVSSDFQPNATKIIPRFKPSFKPRPFAPQSQPQRQTSQPRSIPSFKPANNRPPQVKPLERPPMHLNSNSTKNTSHASVTTGKLPASQSQKTPNFQIDEDADIFDLMPVNLKVRPSFTPAKPSVAAPRFTPKLPRLAPTAAATPKGMRKMPKKNMTSTPKQLKTPSTPKLNHSNNLSDSGLGSSLLSSPISSTAGVSTQQLMNNSQDVIPPTPSTPAMKRPMDMNGTPVAKKPRAKPKIQENIDVEALARNNQLNKVNTITLASWLKERGVTCKAKDKKGELVEKALRLLNMLPPSEP